MIKAVHRFASRYTSFVSRHEWLVLAVALFSFIAAVLIASGLELKSDLKELLPPNYQSVKELNKVLERVGGVGSLIVVSESSDFEANKRFMDDLAKRLEELPPGYIRYFNYRADDIRKFYESHFLYYMDVPDLKKFYGRLKRYIDFEKFKRTPFFLELGDDGQDSVELNVSDLRNKYEKRYSAPIETVDDYYGGEWGRMLIMVIRPMGATITIESARKLVGMVEGVVDRLKPSTYAPGMKVGFCGNVKSTIEEYDTLKRDILSTSLLCIGLVSLVIVLYFLRIRVVFLVGATLLIGVAWTFAVTRVAIGYLNAQTAFLGSIIVGTGINYGIILMARYVEERKRHHEPIESMANAMEATVIPTFLAAATTAVSFLVLLIANIRGLSQFGFIGAVGVVFCWAATILVLPAMVLLSEKVRKFVRPRKAPRRKSAIFEIASRVGAKSPLAITVLFLLLAFASIVVVVRFVPVAIEYDFTKMRNEVSASTGTEALEKRVSRLYKNSMTPSVVLVNSVDEGREVCEAVDAQNEALPEAERRVGSCYSIYDLLPTDQDKKLPIMGRIKRLLSQKWIKDLDNKARSKINRIKRSILGRALSVDDLPEALTRHFEDLDRHRGAVVFINPRPGMLLSDGRNLMRYADTIRDIRLPDGRVFHAASASIVFSDLIEIIKREAPYLTLASLVAVIVIIMLMLKSVRKSAVIIVSLLWAVLIMLGICALRGIKINFFNFIVLPLMFGVGVDYAVNMAMRIRQEWPDRVARAIRHTAPAVILCSSTTIIGYFVLTTANNQALATFGEAAVIGEFACIAAAVLLVPALIVVVARWWGKRRK